VLLLLSPVENQEGLGKLQAWASLQSLNKMRRNNIMNELITLIFKGDKPWILNIMVPAHQACTEMLCKNLRNMGVKQRQTLRE